MTHLDMIRNEFLVVAESGNSILFVACGEICCEINGKPFACESIEEFYELVEFFKDETFEE